MEAIFEFIFKITGRYPHIRDWFVSRKQTWAWLVEWAENVKFPLNPMDPNIRLNKRRGQMQMHH